MSWSDFDWRSLLVPGACAVVAASALAATLYVSNQWLTDIERRYQRARADLSAAAREYREASDDRAVYQRYASRFRERVAAGWIGAEKRLSWIEGLQATNEDLRLPRLAYDIGQQRIAELAGASLPPRLTLYVSPMRLRLGALHEGDILSLMERLRAEGGGLMEVSYCSFDRRGEGPNVVANPQRANIDAECELHWYNLRLEPEADS